MSLTKFASEREEVYKVASFFATFWLVVAIVFVALYLFAPLLGGKLSVSAILHYAGWIVIALAVKFVLKRARKGLQIRAYDFAILCVVVVFNFVIWFAYPINVILSILSIVGLIFSYRAQGRTIHRAE
jgi:chromate transport protein ChrA